MSKDSRYGSALDASHTEVIQIGALYPFSIAAPHAAFQCMWAQYDHILPHARGGRSDFENVYLTCAACNYGRGNYLLEEFDLIHPSLHGPRQGNWDGLKSFR